MDHSNWSATHFFLMFSGEVGDPFVSILSYYLFLYFSRSGYTQRPPRTHQYGHGSQGGQTYWWRAYQWRPSAGHQLLRDLKIFTKFFKISSPSLNRIPQKNPLVENCRKSIFGKSATLFSLFWFRLLSTSQFHRFNWSGGRHFRCVSTEFSSWWGRVFQVPSDEAEVSGKDKAIDRSELKKVLEKIKDDAADAELTKK